MPRFSSVIATLVAAGAVVVFFLPPPQGYTPATMHTAAIVLLTIGLWACGAIPEHLTSLLFFALAMFFAIAPAATVFSGFTSAALWLVMGGLVIAEAVNRTGLGARIATHMFGRLSHSYLALAGAVVLVATLLSFLMPATVGRVLLLIPIVAAAGTRVGLARGSRGANGLMLAALLGTYHSGTGVLPANAPSLVLVGVAEQLYDVHLIYMRWLLLQFPVMAFVKCAVIVWLTCRLFGVPLAAASESATATPLSTAEKRLLAILLVAIALWATDFLHGIHAGWVALAAAVACMMPRIGAMAPAAFNDVKFSAAIYIGAALGLGAVMVASGLANALGAGIRGWMPLEPGADFSNFIVLTTVGAVAGLVTTNIAQPALLGPVVGSLSDAAGWNVEIVLMTVAVGFSTMLLPYQVPPMMVGLQASGISLATTLRIVLPLAAISLLVLNPLDYLWWRLIGFL